MVGNPHRAQICQFEVFEPILLLKFDKRFPVEQFEATVSQSTVPSPPLKGCLLFLNEDVRQRAGAGQRPRYFSHTILYYNMIWPTILYYIPYTLYFVMYTVYYLLYAILYYHLIDQLTLAVWLPIALSMSLMWSRASSLQFSGLGQAGTHRHVRERWDMYVYIYIYI